MALPLLPPYSGGICEISISSCIACKKSVPKIEIFPRVLACKCLAWRREIRANGAFAYNGA